MTWFRIDDQLPSHEKTLRLPRGARRLQAIGAFTLLGAWSSGHLTDGRLPDAVFGELGIPKRVVDDLIAAGFIDRCPPGTEFFQIDLRLHDFLDWNLSSEQVLSERSAAAERQRRAREAAKAKRAAEQAKRDAEGPPPPEEDEESHAVSHGVTNGVTHGEVTPAVTVPPTRPDPTISTNGHLGSSSAVDVTRATANSPAAATAQHLLADRPLQDTPPARELLTRIVTSGSHTTDQIAAALTALARQNLPITAATMRIELFGPARPDSTGQPRDHPTTDKALGWLELARDATQQPGNIRAIGGAP